MNGTWLNWRQAEDWELAAVRHGFQCALDRDMEQLAGLIAAGRDAAPAVRVLDDIALAGGQL